MRAFLLSKDTRHLERLKEHYKAEAVDLKGSKWVGKSHLSKGNKALKIIAPPISMHKLIDLLDKDEYHYACVDAISESCFVKFECKNEAVQGFVDNIQLPRNEDIISIFSDFIHYYIATGNGFMLKMRNVLGLWVGLNRLIPSEMQIVENYDDFGFLKPDYLQVKNGQKTFFHGKDVIHILQKNSLSNAWGLACEPIIPNIETLHEIKKYDFNLFKNGLLTDYFIIVQGGSLGEQRVEYDSQGKERIIDPYAELEELLKKAKGNENSHSSIFLEISEPGSSVKLEPMRKNDNDFAGLKKDLREGIMVYHRVPHRLVSQQTPGQLGGDNNSDMVVFYNMVVKPLQERVAYMLTQEFKAEFGWDVSVEDFDFGDISEVLESIDRKLFRG